MTQRQHPGTERLDAVLASMDADTVGAFEYRDGVCKTCEQEHAHERRGKPFMGHNGTLRESLWQRTECAFCDAKRRAEALQREHARKCELALYNLNTPKLYEGVSFETFTLHGSAEQKGRQRAALDFAKQFVDDFATGNAPPVVVFHGAPGTGKGHLAWSIAHAVTSLHARSARVSVLSDVIRDLREAWRRSDDEGPSEGERLRKYRGVDLLVVDEVSRHAFFGQPQQHLYDLVANRETHMRPTILTTNEDYAGMAEVLGAALASRAAGWDAVIDFGKGDYRLARREQLRARGKAA